MTIDLAIMCAYFALILGVGIWVSKSVKSLDDFSTGNRSYGAAVIFATLSSSFIGGGFTTGLAEKVFTMGLVYVVALWGFSAKEILVATFIAPRMTPFKDAISVGDIMGQLYGRKAKILTGVASGIVCAGIAGAQFAAFGYILNVLTGADASFGIVLGTVIVVIYAALGGMKSVVANDVIHFCVLIVALPLVLLFGVKQAGGFSHIINTVPADHFSLLGSLPLLTVIGLFLNFFFGETLVPPYVQRLLIGRNFKETAKGTLWSGLLSIPFFLLIGVVGLTALTLSPQLDPNLALPYVINQVMPIGLKGLAIAGMMAVVMSSADSFLNAAAISITHDVLKPMSRDGLAPKVELFWSRIVTLIVGALGAIFALSTKSALDILLVAYNFWTPFILVPLVAGIFGFRASSTAFWWGCATGIGATCWWLLVMGETTLNGAIIGIALNLVTFSLVYYVQGSKMSLAKQPVSTD
ncbi:sodium:solute symporter family transporter [Candidatus Berkiella aquae]|uniref:Sodium/glucose cotransporter n=1 Tax=Candidatus Berkiella aquae TaxID=295108 RepID=A0A0Q9YXA5_9GAMM|nr:sodium:solute symporter family protein [Candidatus Berkiella aquae]MCS5712627.1 sodium:solute symporter family protein [Candidatus Berkiella aquae]